MRVIEQTQIDAALDLRSHYLPGWEKSSAVLTRMKADIPGNDFSSILAKAAAVNALYNAQVGYLLSTVQRISDLVDSSELELPGDEPADVIERIALPPDGPTDREGCQVFASKYAHFFIDAGRYPIYDQYAALAVLRHFGEFRRNVMSGKRRYRNFCSLLEEVLSASPLQSKQWGDLDAYLWLAGVYREWYWANRQSRPARINRECRVFFDRFAAGDGDESRLLKQLTGGDWFFEDLSPLAPS